MTRKLMCCVVMLGSALGLAACNDAMFPDDVANKMEQKRLEQPAYGPLEMPPGLSDDLPTPSNTPQPLTRDNP